MKLSFALVLFLFAFLFGGVLSAQDAPSGRTRSFLPELEKIARADGDKIFSICEICDGESRSAIIRPCARCRDAYSIAKLFVVATLGIMEDRGLLDIDEPIYPILKDKFPESFDPKWRDVKISDVIRHRVGFGQTGMLDIDANDSSKWSRDFLSILLTTELQYKPGEKFVYTDAAFYLASRVASEKCGEKLDEFMIRELLEPLGFQEYAFSTDPEGYPIGATGMYLSTEDQAKLGALFVQDGVYEGKQILSKRFVDEAFERAFELYPIGDEGVAFYKGGMNGQLLYMNRKTKRVVSIHSYQGDCDAILKFLVERDR